MSHTSDRWPRWGARLILATRVVDAAFRRFDRLRSRMVLSLASDAVLDRFNDVAYSGAGDYRNESTSFRAYLFPWEEDVIERFFPAPPARVLVGGAGGGREAFVLAERGFEVVAFEPSVALAASMATRAAERGLPISSYRGRYEDLPRLHAIDDGTHPVDLSSARFDAAVIGWGSFSHLRTRAQRVATLRAFAHLTDGPIVVGFLFFAATPRSDTTGAGRRAAGDRFSVHIGFYHEIDQNELLSLAQEAGIDVLHLNTDSRDTNWPHAVLRASRLDASAPLPAPHISQPASSPDGPSQPTNPAGTPS